WSRRRRGRSAWGKRARTPCPALRRPRPRACTGPVTRFCEGVSSHGPGGNDVVEIEVVLQHESDMAAACMVDGQGQLEAQLLVFPDPHEAGVDGAGGGAPTAVVETGFHRELDDRDHVPERSLEPRVLHEILEVGQ